MAVYPALTNNQYRSDIYEVIVSQAGQSQTSYVYKSSRDVDNKYQVLTTDANHWTSFSFSGPVTVKIKLRDGAVIKSASVHPLAKQIHATITDNTVAFTLTNPANLYVEVDGKPRAPLFIFANPPEVNVPTATTTNVIYFGPGVTDLGTKTIKITAGQTVYLAGGAYVKGRIIINGGAYGKGRENVTNQNNGQPASVRGRGILSGIGIREKRAVFSQYMISGNNLEVEGIVLTDSPGPGCVCDGRLTAENIKLLAWTMCSDGIHGGNGSLVKDCFLKVNDDNIHFHSAGMKAIDNVVWLQEFGSALQMGWNVSKSVNGELADGLDIIGDDRGRMPTDKDFMNGNVVALMDVRDRALYKNVVIKNIRHELKPYQLFGVRTMLAAEDKNHTSYRVGRGGIDGMTFSDIAVAQQPICRSVFDGAGSEPGSIVNVTFENLRIAGNLVTATNAPSYIVQRGKTSGFRFLATEIQPLGKNAK